MANWKYDNLGADITILNEVNEDKVCTPDYRWNGKLWDLKTLSSAKAANSAVRHGITQIIENPGGIILNCGNNDISLSELEQVIEKRMHWQPEHTCVDILIVHNKKLYKVIRYKK
jgi:hypothetical protein